MQVDGKPIRLERLRYVMLHKPQGVLSGPDPKAEYPSWETLVKVPERLYAVGRLDQDSEGLLLLTNDGELALHLSHPRYEHPKTYMVQVEGVPNPRKVRRLQHGVMLDDGPDLARTRHPVPRVARRVRWTAEGPAGRDVESARQMPDRLGASPGATGRVRAGSRSRCARAASARCAAWLRLLGHPALRVIRVGLGPLALGDLKPGKWRDLTPGEVRALREAAFHGRAGVPAATRRKDAPGPSQPTKGKPRPCPPTPSPLTARRPRARAPSADCSPKILGYLYFDTGRDVPGCGCGCALPAAFRPTTKTAVTAMAESLRIDVLPPTIDDGRDVTVLADGRRCELGHPPDGSREGGDARFLLCGRA